jgi:hypothetical protein
MIMKSTIGRLFELMFEPSGHTDSELARLLGIDLMALRGRLVDLKKRGVLSGPSGDGQAAIWKSWFPTALATTQASERSGLHASSSVATRGTWWNGMWAND